MRNCLRNGSSQSLYLFLGGMINCSNRKGMYRMLSNILLSLLTPYAEEIIVDY